MLQRCKDVLENVFDITVAPKEHQKTDACGLMAELAQDRVQSSSQSQGILLYLVYRMRIRFQCHKLLIYRPI